MLTVRPSHRYVQAGSVFPFGSWVAPGSGFDSSTAFPPLSGWETRDALLFEADLPGFGRENVEVTFEGRVLTLKGRRELNAPEDATPLLREREAGVFERSLRVNVPIDPDRIEAEFHDGVLRITLPKADAAKPRRITVNVRPEGAQN